VQNCTYSLYDISLYHLSSPEILRELISNTVQNYKIAAATTGAMDAINIGTGLFNPNRQ